MGRPLSRTFSQPIHELLEDIRHWLGALDKSLQSWILQLPNVNEAPHRFGGTEFRFQNLEFMHSHGESQLDIRLSMEDQGRMLKLGKAEPHRFVHAQAGWVVFRIHSGNDLEQAKELIRLAYDNAEKMMKLHESRPSHAEPGA